MSEETKVKQDLLGIANNLDSAEGVIMLKGINTGDVRDLDILYRNVNPQLAFPALLAILTEVYESILDNYELGLSKGKFSEEEIEEMNSITDGMVDNFISLRKELSEKSYARRLDIVQKGIKTKKVEKEEN